MRMTFQPTTKWLATLILPLAMAMLVCDTATARGPGGRGGGGAARGGASRGGGFSGGGFSGGGISAPKPSFSPSKPNFSGVQGPGPNFNNLSPGHLPNISTSKNLSGKFTGDLGRDKLQGTLSNHNLSGQLNGKLPTGGDVRSFLDMPAVSGDMRENLNRDLREDFGSNVPQNWNGDLKNLATENPFFDTQGAQTASQDRQHFRQDQVQQINQSVNQWVDTLETQPFTPAWYAQHPAAFQYQYPHADAWAAASWAAVTGWVAGVATTPAPAAYSETVIYEGDTVYIQGTPQSAVTYDAAAAQLADQVTDQAVDNAVAEKGEWMQLGVYTLSATDKAAPHILVQLAVSKEGEVKGTYYDMLTGATNPVHGNVDKKTQRVAWKVGESDAVFDTGLASLTQDQATVRVHVGETREDWILVRTDQ